MPQPSIVAFDIETIPDVAALRRLHNLPDDLPEREIVELASRLLRQKRGHDFFPLHLHRVVVISCALRRYDDPARPFSLFSLPLKDPRSESEALQQFFQLLDKHHQPTIVSWNGSGFDLPVLQHRAMVHQQRATAYWGGENDRDFKWNSYVGRYHERHSDLMDILSMYQMRGAASLDEFSVLCGLPGKSGSGSSVWESFCAGDLDGIRHYCENDALLTYLLYVRYQHFRGRMNGEEEEQLVRDTLTKEDAWQPFLAAWEAQRDAATHPLSPPPKLL